MRRVVTIVLVALLVTSAGCGAFDSGTDREPYEAGEFEPELLPGLTEDGVTDRAALASAHFDALEGESFRGAHRTTVRNETGAIVSARETSQTVTSEVTSVRIEYDPDHVDPGETVAVHSWTDDDEAYTREVNASGGVTYLPEAAVRTGGSGFPISLYVIYDAIDTVSVERTDGTERYHLEGTGELDAVENASLVLTEAGYVESYRIEGTQTQDGERVSVEYVGGYERIDDGAIDEPSWLEEARTETEEMRADVVGG